ncbi:MerR family transcriptional regulator [Streptomyces sp. NPDC052396]|uniref:MerR family transcriptional regulator n=1 Tax=Streptomyces sp. NPDC052396 TaxID=3365689 RepID=UPI0037CD1872
MRIGELAQRSGVSERSLRYYEQQGLLRSERTSGGHRTYEEWAVDRVIRVQALYAAGLNSKKIAELLPCMRDEDGGPNAATTFRLVDELVSERDRINALIADLVRSRVVLEEAIETVSAGLLADTARGSGAVAVPVGG